MTYEEYWRLRFGHRTAAQVVEAFELALLGTRPERVEEQSVEEWLDMLDRIMGRTATEPEHRARALAELQAAVADLEQREAILSEHLGEALEQGC
jgi:hypothetical protein